MSEHFDRDIERRFGPITHVRINEDGSVSYNPPPPVDAMVSAAIESARLAKACRDNPIKENLILHAVSVWRQGCVHGGPGECPECDGLFLKVIAKRLGLPS